MVENHTYRLCLCVCVFADSYLQVISQSLKSDTMRSAQFDTHLTEATAELLCSQVYVSVSSWVSFASETTILCLPPTTPSPLASPLPLFPSFSTHWPCLSLTSPTTLSLPCSLILVASSCFHMGATFLLSVLPPSITTFSSSPLQFLLSTPSHSPHPPFCRPVVIQVSLPRCLPVCITLRNEVRM